MTTSAAIPIKNTFKSHQPVVSDATGYMAAKYQPTGNPNSEPHVPGALGKYPRPKPVASREYTLFMKPQYILVRLVDKIAI